MISTILVSVANMVAKTDRDILIETQTKVEMIYTLLSNHLEHHFIYSISAIGFAGTALLFAVKLFLNNRKLKKGDE